MAAHDHQHYCTAESVTPVGPDILVVVGLIMSATCTDLYHLAAAHQLMWCLLNQLTLVQFPPRPVWYSNNIGDIRTVIWPNVLHCSVKSPTSQVDVWAIELTLADVCSICYLVLILVLLMALYKLVLIDWLLGILLLGIISSHVSTGSCCQHVLWVVHFIYKH